ncbi:MAG: TIR domain-containing protein [Cyanothece sp. SIO1E1]|nr:TIR domain-containing protein [Cyanothece sp. SIO1E1]
MGDDAAVNKARFFISYRSQEPDLSLAQAFYEQLQAAGHIVFMAGKSIHLGGNWPQAVNTALDGCDYFVLLLSPQSATSEMVIEEVRQAKYLHDTRSDHRPMMLPIRVNLPMDASLNYDLRGYLQRIQQGIWQSPEDTSRLLQEILSLVAEDGTGQLGTDTGEIELLTPAPQTPHPTPSPLPVAEPELPEGQVDLASEFYVERPPIETNCYRAIAKPGALIRIKAPRQMGKTSLMARILQKAEAEGCLKVPLSFQLADGKVFTDLDQFLRWFCASVGRRLRLPNQLADYWEDTYGSKDNCTAYFEEYLLTEIEQPLALGLDEVDMVFQYPEIASDFFGLLRAWHEAAKSNPLWKKLRLVVVHSTEVYIPMNINQSPFNVGLPIELPEFDVGQVQDLARRHGLDPAQTELIEPLQAMVGGHPYLVRLALYNLAGEGMTLAKFLQEAPTEAGLYGDHLRRHLWNLEQHPELAEAVKRVVAAKGPVRLASVQAFQLHSMGLVNLEGNEVVPRCDLYRRYFGDRLKSRR